MSVPLSGGVPADEWRVSGGAPAGERRERRRAAADLPMSAGAAARECQVSGSEPAGDRRVSGSGQDAGVAERAISAGLRAIRIRTRLTQSELAIAASVPRSVVQAIERNRLDRVRVADLRAVAAAVDASVVLALRWRGGDLPRLVNARHAAIHEVVAARFRELAAWTYEPEVSFSTFGERGVIDGLAWHPPTRSLVILEFKSELVDLSDLMGSVDRKRRLATDVVRDRGWRPVSVSTWVVVLDSRTNRRGLSRHRSALRSKFPAEGHAIAAWLRHPTGRRDALSFLPVAPSRGITAELMATRLVRRARDGAPMPGAD